MSEAVKPLWAETKTVEIDGMPIALKRVGTPEDPMLWDRLERRWIRQNADIDRAIRAKLAKEHGSLEAAARDRGFDGEGAVAECVRSEAFMSEEYMDAWSTRVRDLVVHGVVDGANLYVEIHSRFGPDGLVKLAGQIVEYNRPSPKS